ncbi:2-hydroxyacid dehydrogenase [Shewanella gaetbuli]|uniref:D-glycerate dehydrogenase n=1 Tax=Shewanella gaetbuli TaxID=220752 RepID=A0A9X2CL73_9GAMM|nr:NAD(P)-dependent oxidoreductase [Shewanella gaetbuli]MCL1142399.1 D-glycerate dehydrogenase [Shewanella gaetbuli]
MAALPVSKVMIDAGTLHFINFDHQQDFEGVEVICTTPFSPIDAKQIAAFPPNIKLIASVGVGTDHIDLAAAEKAGILVTNTPVKKDDTADFTFALLLALARQVVANNAFIRQGQWSANNMTGVIGEPIHHQTLGIVGADVVSQKVAQRAKGFDMDILYYADKPNQEMNALGARFCEQLDSLLLAADFVSLHCQLTENNQHIINADKLKLMKPSAMLINTARGGLIDEVALIECLQAKSIKAAALDVFETEPDINPQLLSLDNVLLTPHISSGTHACRQDMLNTLLKNISHYLNQNKDAMNLVTL